MLREMEEVGCDLLVDVHGATWCCCVQLLCIGGSGAGGHARCMALLCCCPTVVHWWTCTVRRAAAVPVGGGGAAAVALQSAADQTEGIRRTMRPDALTMPCQQLVQQCLVFCPSVQLHFICPSVHAGDEELPYVFVAGNQVGQRLQTSAVRVGGTEHSLLGVPLALAPPTAMQTPPSTTHPPHMPLSIRRASLAGAPAWPACMMPSATHSRPPHLTSRCDG